MSEISMYEAQKKKLQGLCDEHDLVFRFIKDRYPITLTIKPVQGMDAQISMLENVEEVGYRSPDASMTWIFEDGVLETKVTGGTFTSDNGYAVQMLFAGDAEDKTISISGGSFSIFVTRPISACILGIFVLVLVGNIVSMIRKNKKKHAAKAE